MSWGEAWNERVGGASGNVDGFPFEGPWAVDSKDSKKSNYQGPRFSELLRQLASGDRLVDDDPERFKQLLDSLRRALLYEMRRRGLLWAPPRYLGVLGSSWQEPEAFDELMSGAYEFVFARRLKGLLDNLDVSGSVDGMVFFYIGKFLLEAQRGSDPLGFRLYDFVQQALQHLLESRRLFHIEGDARIRTGTVLGFSPWLSADLCCPAEELAERVTLWGDELLPDLVTSHHHGPVVERLVEAVADLSTDGVELFRFEDLFEPLKGDMRRRWSTIVEEGLEGVGTPEETYEARRRFQDLLRCTAEGLESLKTTHKTREYLETLWHFYRHWVVESDTSRGSMDDLPPDTRLGELLSIPRNRLPDLRERLGTVVKGCQRPGFEGEGAKPRDPAKHWGELRARTRDAVARWRADRAAKNLMEGPLEPGDLVVLPRLDVPPVEWLVLGGQRGDRRPVVPVDTLPFRGRHDLILEGDSIARREGKVWLPTKVLGTGRRVGRVGDGALDRLNRGVEEPPPALLSSDSEPEYKEWIESLQTAGRSLGGMNVSARDAPSPSNAFSVVQTFSRPSALAVAALFLAVLGLSSLHVVDRASLGRLLGTDSAQPSVVRGEKVDHIRYRDTTRGAGELLEIDGTRDHFVFLDLYGVEEYPAFRVALRDMTGQEMWRSEPFEFDFDVRLVVPAGSLDSGRYDLVVYGVGADGTEVLIES